MEAYNRAISDVPHCYPVTTEEYVSATTSTESEHDQGILRAQQTLLARRADRIIGFSTASVRTPSEEGSHDIGVIRMLWYERGCREAGQMLLSAVEEHVRGHGVNEIVAFDPDRLATYYLPYGYVSDRWGHVKGLLGINGYARVEGEVFLDWPDFQPPDQGQCPIEAEVRTDRRPGKGKRDNLAVSAHVGQEQVGICTCSCGGDFSGNSRAQEWVLTTWLGVDDALQGKGLGRFLLLRALNDAREVGYRHAAISTDWTNHRALLLYSNIGYRAVDWTSMYRKGATNEST